MCRLPSASVFTGHDAVMMKPASIKTLGQRVPGAGGLVREHHGHDAVGLQHAALFGEDGRHASR